MDKDQNRLVEQQIGFNNDCFHINTKKPLSLLTRLKKKIVQYSKPFSLGILFYLTYHLLKKIGSTLIDLGITSYYVAIDLLITSLQNISNVYDKINFSIFSQTTQNNTPQTIGEITHNIDSYAPSMHHNLFYIIYFVGIFFAFKATYMFNEYYNTQEKTLFSEFLNSTIISMLFIAVPSFLNML